MENRMAVSHKLKIELSHHPAIPHLCIYPKKIFLMQTLIRKDTCTTMFTAAFTIAKIRKQLKSPSTDE